MFVLEPPVLPVERDIVPAAMHHHKIVLIYSFHVLDHANQGPLRDVDLVDFVGRLCVPLCLLKHIIRASAIRAHTLAAPYLNVAQSIESMQMRACG
jgi:hypothetical protein